MEAVLKEMGVEHYDRSVVYVSEFSYSECTCIHVRHVVCEAWIVSEPDPSCGGGGKGLGTILHSSCPQVGMLT